MRAELMAASSAGLRAGRMPVRTVEQSAARSAVQKVVRSAGTKAVSSAEMWAELMAAS